MRVKFEVRSLKKGDGISVPIYVRATEGMYLNQATKTRLSVVPYQWDPISEAIKPRVLCKPEERAKILNETSSMRIFLIQEFAEAQLQENFEIKGWLKRAVEKYYKLENSGKALPKPVVLKKQSFDSLFDEFLARRDICPARIRHYEVVRRMLHRYAEFVKVSQHKKRYVFDVDKVDASTLDDIYNYLVKEYAFVELYPEILEKYPETRQIEKRGQNTMTDLFKKIRAFFRWCYQNDKISKNPFDGYKIAAEEYGTPIYLTLGDLDIIYKKDFSDQPALEKQRDIFVFQCNVGCRVGDLLRLVKRDIINGAVEYIPTKTIKETARTVAVPLNNVARSIVEKYADLPGDSLLPFISSDKYNNAIKEILTKAGITYLVTQLDPLTRKEKKTPINEIASSHMARRTFIGNIYKLVKDPNLVSALTGHVEGSRAFNRYRTIDMDMKKDLVNILDTSK